jgi:hypothetical protein
MLYIQTISETDRLYRLGMQIIPRVMCILLDRILFADTKIKENIYKFID